MNVSTVAQAEPAVDGFWFYVEEPQFLVSADDPNRSGRDALTRDLVPGAFGAVGMGVGV